MPNERKHDDKSTTKKSIKRKLLYSCAEWCLGFILFVYIMYLTFYVLFSFSQTYKAIQVTDLIILPVVTCGLQLLRYCTSPINTISLVVCTIFHVYTFIMTVTLTARNWADGNRTPSVIYDTDGITLLNGLTRKPLDAAVDYNPLWYDIYEATVVAILLVEASLCVLSITVYRSKWAELKATNREGKAKSIDKKLGTIGKVFHDLFLGSKEEEKEYNHERADGCLVTSKGLVRIFIALSFITLMVRVMIVACSVWYDIPYWTEQDSPFALYYAFVFGVVIMMRFAKERYDFMMVTAMTFFYFISAIVVCTWAMHLDKLLLDSKGYGLAWNYVQQYRSILVDASEMGNWIYEVPSGSVIPKVHGNMTFLIHWIALFELSFLYMFVLLSFSITIYGHTCATDNKK